MSLEVCLSFIEQHFDREQNIDLLVDELAEHEALLHEEGALPDYHPVLAAFLNRVEELYADEELGQELLPSAVRNLRLELEAVRNRRSPADPLEHLFRDMTRFESGTIPASTLRTTLSRYEELVLALRHQFEASTPLSDESPLAVAMRSGLDQLERAGRHLRNQIDHDTDALFDSIRAEFEQGTVTLKDFRRKANFVPK